MLSMYSMYTKKIRFDLYVFVFICCVSRLLYYEINGTLPMHVEIIGPKDNKRIKGTFLANCVVTSCTLIVLAVFFMLLVVQRNKKCCFVSKKSLCSVCILGGHSNIVFSQMTKTKTTPKDNKTSNLLSGAGVTELSDIESVSDDTL